MALVGKGEDSGGRVHVFNKERGIKQVLNFPENNNNKRAVQCTKLLSIQVLRKDLLFATLSCFVRSCFDNSNL